MEKDEKSVVAQVKWLKPIKIELSRLVQLNSKGEWLMNDYES